MLSGWRSFCLHRSCCKHQPASAVTPQHPQHGPFSEAAPTCNQQPGETPPRVKMQFHPPWFQIPTERAYQKDGGFGKVFVQRGALQAARMLQTRAEAAHMSRSCSILPTSADLLRMHPAVPKASPRVIQHSSTGAFLELQIPRALILPQH